MARALWACVAVWLAACGGGSAGSADSAPGAEGGQPGDAATDGRLPDAGLADGASDSATPPDGGLGADASPDGPPPGLPFDYARPAAGTPVPAAELTAITDTYLDLLAQTRYFDVLDERVVGWPESDPQQRYWYGHWWSGAGFVKEQGDVSLVHGNMGADNPGIPSSLVLESVCLAHRVWPTPKLEHIARRLLRALNAWIFSMQRYASDPAGTLLARVSYPESVTSTDSGRTLVIDYSADRPGVDSYCLYVHLPTNPYWGDIYIKNKRSKDDIGHMLRAIGTLKDCEGGFDAATRADIDEVRTNYSAWSRRVEDDGWAIATLDQDLNVYIPPLDSTMSHFYGAGNAECDAMLAIRLLGRGDPGGFACGNGVNAFEYLVLDNPSNGEIIRSFHEAAARNALLWQQDSTARELLGGLAQRMDQAMGWAESGSWPVHMNAERLVKLLVHSANVGVPLTAREVRWIHGQIAAAHTSFVTNAAPAVYRLYDPTTPDGAYDFTPPGEGIDFTFFASLAGTCTATYRNPTTQPLLDCARLQTFTP